MTVMTILSVFEMFLEWFHNALIPLSCLLPWDKSYTKSLTMNLVFIANRLYTSRHHLDFGLIRAAEDNQVSR